MPRIVYYINSATRPKTMITLDNLTPRQRRNLEFFDSMVYSHFCEKFTALNITQFDSETGSAMVELTLPSEGIAYVWVNINGALTTVSGARILNADRTKPKRFATNDQIFNRG